MYIGPLSLNQDTAEEDSYSISASASEISSRHNEVRRITHVHGDDPWIGFACRFP
jgi:hypothetical protein